jgi:hypothetical protein
MKRLLLSLVIALIVAPALIAGPLPTITFVDGPGNLSGGVFYATAQGLGTFPTFCIEYNEHLSFNHTYYYSESYEAMYDGQPAPFTDPISLATAYLYRNYTTIAGAGISAYSNSAAQNTQIQQAIWYFEDEPNGDGTSPYAQAVIALLGSNWHDAANGKYGVAALNIWTHSNGTGVAQDVLHVPDGGLTVFLLGIGLGGLTFCYRKIKA